MLHGVGVFAGGQGADLDVEELVLRLVADGDVVAALLEGGEEVLCVFAVGDCCYLNHDCGGWPGYGR